MPARLRFLFCAFIAALMVPAAPAAAQQALPSFAELEAEGAVIGEIVIDTEDIFDPDDPQERKLFYRAANALHIQTKPWVIRRYLLFKPGEHVYLRLILETERLIRANSTVYDVVIRPLRYQDGVVDVEVRTRDTWTLQPSVRVRRTGGKNSGAFALKETNLLGTGTAIGIERSSSVDRKGTLLSLQHDHLFDGWTSIAAQRASYDDGSAASASITRPFYALDTRWAAGASASRFDRLDPFYVGGENVAQYRHHGESREAFGGWSPGLINGWTRRYTLGVTHQADEYAFYPGSAPPQLPAGRTLAGPYARYEVIQDDYLQVMNRDLIERPEYLAMGFQSALQVGRSLTAFGATDRPWLVSGSVSNGFRLGMPGQQLLASAGFSAQYGSSVGDVRTLGGSARYFAPRTGPFLLYLAASTDHVWSPNQVDELLLGGDNGLRGYPLRYQRGTHRTLFTAEERYYSDVYPLRLFRVGAAVFFDVGRAWGSQTPNPTNGWLSDIGVGLRILSARASFGNTLHIDLAIPLNRTDPNVKAVQLLVGTSKTF